MTKPEIHFDKPLRGRIYDSILETIGFYIQPDPQCSHPGVYYINTYDLPSRPIYGIYSLSLHESVPGHHLQIALQAELQDFPAFRVNGDWTAFIEGWALYAESLGESMGLYTDPSVDFGRLDDEMLRAGRLVVDTGIHALGWTRQQAIDLLVNNTALSVLEITSEVDRYISWPGQALAYKSGQMKILDLKRRSMSALGDFYDERDFHDVVLGQGSLPLQILDTNVQHWIDSVLASNGNPPAPSSEHHTHLPLASRKQSQPQRRRYLDKMAPMRSALS